MMAMRAIFDDWLTTKIVHVNVLPISTGSLDALNEMDSPLCGIVSYTGCKLVIIDVTGAEDPLPLLTGRLVGRFGLWIGCEGGPYDGFRACVKSTCVVHSI